MREELQSLLLHPSHGLCGEHDGDALEVLEVEELGVAGDDEIGFGGERTSENVIIIGIAGHGGCDRGRRGKLCDRKIAIDAEIDAGADIEKPLGDYFSRYQTVAMDNYKLTDDELIVDERGAVIVEPTSTRAA